MTSIGMSVEHEAAGRGASSTPRLGGTLMWAGRAVRKWFADRRAEKQLTALDDRMLDDIGLERGQVSGAVRGAVARDERPIPYWAR